MPARSRARYRQIAAVHVCVHVCVRTRGGDLSLRMYVCRSIRARVSINARLCMWVRVRTGVCMHMCACVLCGGEWREVDLKTVLIDANVVRIHACCILHQCTY